MKVCTKCKETKSLGEFHKDEKSKDGRRSSCKECTKAYCQANREKRIEYTRKWYQRNKDHVAEYDKKYKQENREKVRERKRKWYHENREKVREHSREYNRKYYDQNPILTQSRIIVRTAQKRAKDKKLPIDLDFISTPNIANWLKRQPRCECCNIKFRMGRKGNGRYSNSSPSLDKFYPKKGYVKDNVYLICSKCNTLKSNVDSKRLRIVVDWMEKIETEKS